MSSREISLEQIFPGPNQSGMAGMVLRSDMVPNAILLVVIVAGQVTKTRGI